MNNKRVHFATVNYSIHLDNKPVKIKSTLIILAGLFIGCSDFNTEPVVLLVCTATDEDGDEPGICLEMRQRYIDARRQ